MLNIRRRIFAFIPLLASQILYAQEDKPGIKVVDPNKKVPVASAAALDTEHFEVGINGGFLSVEDFNTNPSFAVALRYYFSEKLLLEGSLGVSTTQRSSTEESDNLDRIGDRDFQYVSISAGYQFLKGRSFWGKRRKYNTGLYILGGIEQVDFAEKSETGLVVSLSYKTLITDWMTINMDFKNHIVNRELQGDEKITQNGEILFGINFIF